MTHLSDIMEQLYRQIGIGLIIRDRDGIITQANSAALSILGITDGSISQLADLESGFSDENGDAIPVENQPHIKVLKTGNTGERQRVRFNDLAGGNDCLLDISAYPLHRGRPKQL